MSKIAEQKALEAYPVKNLKDNFGTRDINRCMREACIQGYDQAMQDFLEKAEGFLTGKVVLCFRVSWTEQQTPFLDFNIRDIVEQFKNYMQDESEN